MLVITTVNSNLVPCLGFFWNISIIEVPTKMAHDTTFSRKPASKWKALLKNLNWYKRYSKDSIIRPGLIIFKLFENGLSTVLIIESFEISLNSTYNRDSTYNFSSSKSWLSTVLIKVFKTILTIFIPCMFSTYIQIGLLK